MAKGKSSKWITARIERPITLGNDGIQINIWSKYGRKKQGDVYISVGGVSWKFPGKQKWKKISWDKLEEIMTKK
jgi:hypothetical protein